MKHIFIRTLTFALALLLCLPLAACGNAADKVITTTAQSDATEDKPVELDKELKIATTFTPLQLFNYWANIHLTRGQLPKIELRAVHLRIA